MKTIEFDLQLFAETQTTGLNSTGNDLSPGMREYFEKALLKNAKPNLVHDQFAQKRPIPKNNGKTIQFRKFSPFAKAQTPLTEGVTPAGNTLNQTELTATVSQYGDFTQISDLLDMTHGDPIMQETTELHGSQAGLTLDCVTRDVVAGGTNALYQPKADGTAILSRTTLDATSLLTVDTIFQAAALLKGNNAPMIDGSYVCIVHPYVAKDLMVAAKGTGSWLDINKYANPSAIFEGELGKIGNVRFVESTNAKIWKGTGCPEGLAVFGCIVLGANAYATTDVEGGGMRIIIKQLGSGGTSDPLDQRATIGWKAIKTAERLAEEFMVRIECTSSFSATASAN